LPAEKIMSPQEAISLVRDGSILGLGGDPMSMNAVSLAANLILLGKKDFHLVVSPTGGFVADMLIGAGAARIIEFAQVGFEELGMAPNFRRRAQDGSIATLDHT
jgi:glutaconate CoA-transferase subunit A